MTRPVALVTGGSRGIGAAIAAELAAEGYALTLVARGTDTLKATADSFSTKHRVDIHIIAANMADETQIRDVADQHRQMFGRLDVLVLSAGVGTAGPVVDMTMRAYQRTMDVNTKAPFILIQELLPLLRQTAQQNPHRGAKIIALSSLTGVAGEAGLAAYGASKAALISLCETVSLEESMHGVTATALSPGYVDTDMSAWKHSDIQPDAMLRTADIAELALAITRLSVHAVVPNIAISRAGEQIWRA